MTRVQVNPIKRRISEELGGGHRISDDQHDRVAVSAIQDILVQRPGKGTPTFRHRRAVIVLLARTLGSAAPARVDSDHRKGLPALLDDFTQRAKASTEVGPDFNQTGSFRKPMYGLFLRGSPLKPALYFIPVHASLQVPLRAADVNCFLTRSGSFCRYVMLLQDRIR
jgi:hypothetical protein